MKTLHSLLIVLSVILVIQCEKEENNPQTSVSETVNSTEGGTVSITTPEGLKIDLIIPKDALFSDTEIVLKLAEKDPKNPFSDCKIPGIEILPEGTELKTPAVLQVQFPENVESKKLLRIFYINSQGKVYPLASSRTINHIIQGQVYHFSHYSCANPTALEIRNECTSLFGEKKSIPPEEGDLDEALTELGGNLEWVELLQEIGEEGWAESILNETNKIFEKKAWDFLDRIPPENPCEKHIYKAVGFYEQMMFLGIEGDIMDSYKEHVNDLLEECKLSGEIHLKAIINCHNELGYEETTYTSTIRFTLNIENYSEIVGKGINNITWIGRHENCNWDIAGTGIIDLEGKFIQPAGKSGLWVDASITYEEIHLAGTEVCDDTAIPLSGIIEEEETNVQLKLENGYKTQSTIEGDFCNITTEYEMIITHMNL